MGVLDAADRFCPIDDDVVIRPFSVTRERQLSAGFNHRVVLSLIKPSPAMATHDIVKKAGAVKQ